jgi:hypothetical protein
MTDQETKVCPFCSETILRTARKCKHCGEMLDAAGLPGPADIQFKDLCELLGSAQTALVRSLGPPDEEETNEYGTRFLFYRRYRVLFTFSSERDIATFVCCPIVNSFGTRFKLADGAFQMDGLDLGISRQQVQSIWGEPSEQNEHWMAFRNRRGRTKTGSEYEISLSFGDNYDDGHDGLTEFSGRLSDDTPPATPDPAQSRVEGSAQPSKGACFVATAAFGETDTSVVILRAYRDRVLDKSAFGRQFVWVYYRVSPPMARFIALSELRRRVTRALLRPLVQVCRDRLAK